MACTFHRRKTGLDEFQKVIENDQGACDAPVGHVGCVVVRSDDPSRVLQAVVHYP